MKTLSHCADVSSARLECVVIPFRPRSRPQAARPPRVPASSPADPMLLTIAASAAAATFVSLTLGWIDAYRWVEATLRLAVVC